MTTRAPAPRKRDSEATRRAILDAGAEQFTQHGYDGTGIRDIARRAGIDTRLITRYFGSKEGLFAEVVDEAFQKPLLMAPGLNHQVAVELLSDHASEGPDGLLLTLRSVGNDRAAQIMREHLEKHYQRRLADALPGDDVVGRAALLIAICTGVQTHRNILRNSALQGDPDPVLVRRLEAALDVVATDDLGT